MTEDDHRPPDALARVIARLDALELALEQNAERLRAIEERLDTGTRAARTPPNPEKTYTPPPSPIEHDESGRPFGQGGERRAAKPETSAAATGGATARRRDVESLIGGSWFNWIGIIAIIFGVAFFLKYAFENEWIGHGARVALGALAGLGFLAAGERLRLRGFRQYAFLMSGGGILILYLSVFAAHAYYALLGQAPAFLLMTCVTTTAVLLSARLSALPIAALALIGGFLTPVLLSTGQDNQVVLFTYIAFLDAGVLTLAYFKQWRSLNYLSFAATVLMFIGWALAHYAVGKLWPTLFFLTFFFVLYSALALVHNVLKRREAAWLDITLISLNATFYFAACYLLLNDAGYQGALAGLALVLSAFHLALFFVALRGHAADRLLTYSYLAASITFLTVAAAIRFEQQWATIAWSIEALMLVWVARRSGQSAPRHAALAVFGIAMMHWLGNDMPAFAFRAGTEFVPLLNARALSCAVLVGSLVGAARLLREEGAAGTKDAPGERAADATIYAMTATALALTLLTLDVSDYFTQRKLAAGESDGLLASRLENSRQFSISALWTIYGLATFIIGVRRNFKVVRVGALALLVVATIKVSALDISYYAAAWHVPFFNQTFAAFALLVAAYALAARFYRRGAGIGDDERAAVPVLVVIANVLAILALSAEASGYFDSRARTGGAEAADARDLELAKQLSLSIIWAAYGGAMFVVGRVRRSKLLRMMALLLLGLTTLKVFFIDLSSLDRVYRIISFIVLGAILLTVSYIYQKSQRNAASQ